MDRRTAFVLAGGGTKGAFEVGAMEHLVHTLGLGPDIITSTSAGSILGVVLAQARGAEELGEAVRDLRSDLLAMTRTDQVFGRQPWLEAFAGTPFGDAVTGFITERTRPPVPGGDPDPHAVQTDAATTAGPGRHHRNWQHFIELIDQIPAASRAHKVLEGHDGSILTLDPLEAALRGRVDMGIRPVDNARVAREGLELRMAVTALQAGHTHYVCGDGTIMGPDARTPVGYSAVDAVEGALASSTVPMIFDPRPIGGDVYVDGGCLQNIPLEAAVSLGAEDIYAVAAVPLHAPRKDVDFTKVNFIGIYLRTSAEISFQETQRRNLEVARPEDSRLTLVAPTIDVVGPFEVQQGLMLMDMDYGRLRAEEATADLAEPERGRAMDATDAVVVARERAWYLEEACLDDGTVSDARRAALRALKTEVAAALATRRSVGFAEPGDAEAWVQSYEPHDRPIPNTFPDDFPDAGYSSS